MREGTGVQITLPRGFALGEQSFCEQWVWLRIEGKVRQKT